MRARLCLPALTGALTLAACGAPDTPDRPAADEAVASPAPAEEPAPPAAPPGTDVFVAALSFDEGAPRVFDVRRVTQGGGYDNQPYFLPGEDAFYFVSEGESGKTDLWRYDIGSNAQTQITNTPDVSEYSPKPAPGDGGVSYIQETDPGGEVTRVHRLSLSDGESGAVVAFQPLGYYAWLDDGAKLGVYLRTEPGELHLIDVVSGETRKVVGNIGRSLQPSPDGRRLYFTVADESGVQTVMVLDLDDGAVSTVVPMMDGMLDFWALFDDEGALARIFAGAGPVLYEHRAEDEGETAWRLVADFAGQDLTGLSRLSVSDNHRWIALVFDE